MEDAEKQEKEDTTATRSEETQPQVRLFITRLNEILCRFQFLVCFGTQLSPDFK